MSEIGALSVSIDGELGGFNRTLSQADQRLANFGQTVARVATRVATLSVAAASAAGTIGLELLRNTANAADEMSKLSQRVGVSVEDLGRLTHAANMSGVSQGDLTSSMQRLARELQNAEAGTSAAAKALEALGIDARDATGALRDQADIMADVADRFSSMEDGARKTALAQDIFGRSGAQLIPLLNAGSDGLRQMGDEAERLGLVFSTETAQAAERLNDNIARMSLAMQGTTRQALSPIIVALANFTDNAREAAEESDRLYREVGYVTPVHRARDAFESLGDMIARSIQNWSDFLFAQSGGQAKVNSLVQERIDLEEYLARTQDITGGTKRGELQRRQQRAAAIERIEEIKGEIAALQEYAKQRAMIERDMADRPAAAPAPSGPLEVSVAGGIPTDLPMPNYDAQLQRLREFVMSESELEQERHRQRLDLLAEALFSEQIGHEDQYHLLEDLQRAHEDRMQAMRDRGDQERIAGERRVQQSITQMRQQALNSAVGLLQAFAGESKAAALAAIVLNKGLMIAQTIQSTAAAQMRALAELGPIAGGAAAAKIGMLGKIQVGIIAATGLKEAAGLGGGGSSFASISGGGGAGGGTAGAASTTQAAPPMAGEVMRRPAVATINIVGETFGRAQVAELIEAINELSNDGVRLVFA